MGISTGAGDTGTTGLASSERLDKDDIRIECLGSIDELNSFLGRARYAVSSERLKGIIGEIQKDLFTLGAALARKEGTGDGHAMIGADDTGRITGLIERLEEESPLSGFAVPGSVPGKEGAAELDICRAVCRRAERRLVSLNRRDRLPPQILVFINRLSDLLFLMARFEEAQI